MAAADRRLKTAALLGALAASLFYLALAAAIGPAQNQDFLNLYTGGQLARSGHFADLYDFDLQMREQDRITGGVRLHFPFVRPPFYALLLSPLSWFAFHTAYRIWIAFHIGLLLCVWAWSWRRFGPESIIYCSLFLPSALGIAHGQDCVVFSILGLAILEAAEHRKDRLAGVFAALTLAKFHLFLLVPIAMAVRRRWMMLAAYLASATALAVGSMALVGPAGVKGYLALLTRQDLVTLSPSPERMLGVRSIAVNLGAGFWLEAMLAAVVVALVLWTARTQAEDWRWISAAIVGSLLLSPHTYEYDAAVLLAFLVAAAHRAGSPVTRAAAVAALVPVPYLMTLAGSPWAAIPSLVLAAYLASLPYSLYFTTTETRRFRLSIGSFGISTRRSA